MKQLNLPEYLKNGSDLMIDIETLSTAPNAVVLSIGALKFNPQVLNDEHELATHTFYCNVDRDDAARYGLHTCPDTIAWWAAQSPEAQAVLYENPLPLKDAIGALTAFIGDIPRVGKCWAKDPDFDVTILREAFKAVRNGGFPVPYYLTRSVRTITDLAYPNEHDTPVIRIGTHHNALDDCVSQALMVQHCYHRLDLVRTDTAPIL